MVEFKKKFEGSRLAGFLARRSPRTRLILKIGLAISILAVGLFDSWLGTCAYSGCPTPREIQRYRPDEGGRILDRGGILMGRLAQVRRVNIPLTQVPSHVREAFVAVEDRRFYRHNGVDWRGFVRAASRNVRAGGVREGFSTITMQAARNTFVVRRFKSRSLSQKLIELRMARLMERSLTKDQILELYLNAIYMGNGVYGIEAASRDLFGRSAPQLTVSQGAMLAALPKGPTRYTPRRHPKRALQRRNLVLSIMVKEGYLTLPQFSRYARDRLRIARDEWRPSDALDTYALDAVRALVDSALKEREEDVADITVYTTLDARAQRAADNAVRKRASAIGRSVQGAMVAMDPRNGDVRAIVGGRYYERGNFNRALAAKRQPGSVFKPFVFAAALAAGYTPASEVNDDPVDVIQGRKIWSPANFNHEYLGRITFRRALMRSANAATVRISTGLGPQRSIDVAHRNGITSEIEAVPAVALGALEVTPFEIVRAYAPFANGGFKVTPRLVKRVEAADGSVLWASETAELTRAMDPRDAYQITSMLRGVVDYGTGRVLRDYGVRGAVAGKTGTTNNGADVWFIGYTPTVVAGFWFGRDDPRSLGGDASGGRLAAPAFAEFFLKGWQEKPAVNAWDPPPGMSMRVIDARTGYLASEWCPVRQQEWFKPGTEPGTQCPEHGEPYDSGEGDWQAEGQEQRAPEDFAKKIGKALGKIFRF